MIYFDNSATTKPYQEVVDLVAKISYEEFGNPASLHSFGMRAERILEQSRKQLAETLKADPEEIIFTSGGTESINMAIKGTAEAMKRSGKHILSTPIEHPAALESLKVLEEMGFTVEMLNVDDKGRIDPEELKRKIRKDTILVNIMMVNNETGVIQPVAEAAQIIKSVNPKTVFHVDAVQAYGKLPIDTRKLKADIISFSAHKIHGPRGVGMMYLRHGTKIRPILTGGGQEKQYRSGTVNVPGIAGFACAAVRKTSHMEEDNRTIRQVRERLIAELKSRMPDQIRINSPEDGLPGILSISFRSVKSEVILHALEQHEIYVSSGSACSSKKNSISHVIKALNIPAPWSDGTIRFSFCGENNEEEATACAQALQEILNTYALSK
ncbi:MAG TPA: cysteine desulfurase family protein [Thermoclostridium caenicola]|nr:cysteine desulfurase family protein [Thermoclostridium caenicola]